MENKCVLYCWELGKGLGHIYQMRDVVVGFLNKGWKVVVLTRDIKNTRRILKDLNVTLHQSPYSNEPTAPENPLNHADILHAHGYSESSVLEGLVKEWIKYFVSIMPDVVVVEAAPTASLAARVSNQRVITIDTGFFCPPKAPLLPALRDWESVSTSRLRGKEHRVLAIVNSVMDKLERKRFNQFWDILGENVYWLTWPEFSHFKHEDTTRMLGVTAWTRKAQSVDSTQEKILVYFSNENTFSKYALEWAANTGREVEAFLPGWSKESLIELERHENFRYVTEPMNLDESLPSTWCVLCHGGFGTVSKSIAYGVVPLIVPTHVEQYRMLRALVAHGFTASIKFNSNEGATFNAEDILMAIKNISAFRNKKLSEPGSTEKLSLIVEQSMLNRIN